MKLIVFVHALNEDGATKVVYSSLKSARIRGAFDEVLVVSSCEGPMRSYFEAIGINVFVVNYKRRGFLSPLRLKRLFYLARLIRRYDYVWVNSLDQSYLLMFYIKLFRKRCLIFGHESLTYDSLHFTHFSLSPRVNTIISQLLATGRVRLALPSRTTVSNASRWFGVPTREVEYLPYGFEEESRSNRADFDDDVFSFIVVGGIGYRKSQYQVVAAFKIVDEIVMGDPERYRDWRLNVLGVRYLQKESQDFLHHVNQVFCSLNIRYSPFLPVDRVKDVLSDCHCLISASMNEALPLNVVEMMQVGGVVIGSDCEGQDELIQDGVTGYSFERGQVSELARTILRVLDRTRTSPDELRRVCDNAARLITTDYGCDVFDKRFLDIYRRTASGSDTLIVYVSPWNYEVRENRSQPIARELARLGYRVLYVNFPVGQRRLSRIRERMTRGRYLKIMKNLYCSIGGPLVYKYDWKDVRALGETPTVKQKAMAKYIKAIISDKTFDRSKTVLLSNRAIGAVFRRFIEADCSIMDIEDPWPYLHEHWDFDSREELVSGLRLFADSTDFALANGPVIKDIAEQYFYDKDISIFPCGVDRNLFFSSYNEPPADMPQGERSIVFSGMVDDRIDFALLSRVCEEMPGVNVILLGAVHEDVQALAVELFERHDNLYFLGQKDVHHLKLYFMYADVFIIPYMQEGGWSYTFPAKLFEYMTYGCPIVTSFRIEGVPENYVYSESVPDRFIGKLTQVIDGDEYEASRVEFSDAHTWDKLVARLGSHIEASINPGNEHNRERAGNE